MLGGERKSSSSKNSFGGMGGGRSVSLVSGRLEGRDFTSMLMGREPREV